MKLNAVCFLVSGLMLFVSCTETLDAPSDEKRSDNINGFTAEWSNSATDIQRQAIAEIINDLVFVEGGYFMMGNDAAYDGDTRSNESPMHPVQLSDYYIMAHEVSYDQVLAVLGKQDGMYDLGSEKSMLFNYDDWLYFIAVVNEKCGLDLTLPTEAQWEFAARGGNMSEGYKYPGSDTLEDVWSGSRDCAPVTAPNELGLYDMADGYGEWCLDTYENYQACNEPVVNPRVNFDTDKRVVRGGCYASKGTYKNWNSSMYTASNYGVSDIHAENNSLGDIRMCRSTARAYVYARVGGSIIRCRLVINCGDK